MSVSHPHPDPKLTLGPVLFNWSADMWQDFYFKIADESPVDTVYLGDIICPKRHALVEKVRPTVIDRLKKAGKNIVQSSLIIIVNEKDQELVNKITTQTDTLVEANDMTAVELLKNKSFYAGPYLNIYNEDTLKTFVKHGAMHVTFPFEINGTAINALAKKAAHHNITSEVMVYGRSPLAISSRCYHAKAYGKEQNACQFVCMQDPDGKTVSTLDNHDFITINGKQTMSHTCTNLVQEIEEMKKNGVTHFRISPHTCDMVLISQIFDSLIRSTESLEGALYKFKQYGFGCDFSNGFYHGKAGHEWVEKKAA